MTIYNGLVASLVFNSNDISEDVLSLGISTPMGIIDVTALDLVGMQRIFGRVDAKLTLKTRFSSAAAGAHATFKAATAAGVSASCVITTTAGPVFTFHGIVSKYDVSVGNDLKLEGDAEISMDTGVAGAWT